MNNNNNKTDTTAAATADFIASDDITAAACQGLGQGQGQGQGQRHGEISFESLAKLIGRIWQELQQSLDDDSNNVSIMKIYLN